MQNSYPTALSHLILAITGVACLVYSNAYKFGFPHIAYIFTIINNLVGLWRYGNPTYGYKIYRLFRITKGLQNSFVLPCVVTTVWLIYGYMMELALAHIFLSIISFIAFIKSRRYYSYTNFIVLANILSLVVICVIHQNYFGVVAGISYAFDHFIANEDHETYFDIPSQDLYNYAMCFFLLFSIHTVWE